MNVWRHVELKWLPIRLSLLNQLCQLGEIIEIWFFDQAVCKGIAVWKNDLQELFHFLWIYVVNSDLAFDNQLYHSPRVEREGLQQS